MQSTKNAPPLHQGVSNQNRLPSPATDDAIWQRLRVVLDTVFRTRVDTAVIVGLTTSQIAGYLRGDFLPSFPVLYRLSLLGISIDWLLLNTGTMFTRNSAGDRLYHMVQRGDKLTIDGYLQSLFEVAKQPVSLSESTSTQVVNPEQTADPMGLFGATA